MEWREAVGTKGETSATGLAMAQGAIITRVLDSPLAVDAGVWNALLAQQPHPTPFMRHEYLAALHSSGSAVPATGWLPRWLTLWHGNALIAACPLYVKDHSRGEYVFDWSWADAYHRHGVAYYPKAVVAVPFTPVPGTRLLARDAASRAMLLQAVRDWCEQAGLSSCHILFAADSDLQACAAQGLLLRHTVQFHWRNAKSDAPNVGFTDFEDFLHSLAQEKRKKIRQERRRVSQAGVVFRWVRGAEISQADWDFFYRCYERTYLEHGNLPYLSRDFFEQMSQQMPENWLLFVAERGGKALAASLLGLGHDSTDSVAYGRYWGALERVDCLHFEACYYQPLEWCIAHGIGRFEGGAQGEHKMARALLPVPTSSAHWLSHPGFADAIERYLVREGQAINHYLSDLHARSPFKRPIEGTP